MAYGHCFAVCDCGLLHNLFQVKTEEQIATEQAWYGSEKVWLVHKDGFSLGKLDQEGCRAWALQIFTIAFKLWVVVFS